MFRPLGRGVDLVQTRNERITLARNCEALIPQLRGLAPRIFFTIFTKGSKHAVHEYAISDLLVHSRAGVTTLGGVFVPRPSLRSSASSALELRFNAENAEIRRGLNKKLAQATLLKTHHFY